MRAREIWYDGLAYRGPPLQSAYHTHDPKLQRDVRAWAHELKAMDLRGITNIQSTAIAVGLAYTESEGAETYCMAA